MTLLVSVPLSVVIPPLMLFSWGALLRGLGRRGMRRRIRGNRRARTRLGDGRLAPSLTPIFLNPWLAPSISLAGLGLCWVFAALSLGSGVGGSGGRLLGFAPRALDRPPRDLDPLGPARARGHADLPRRIGGTGRRRLCATTRGSCARPSLPPYGSLGSRASPRCPSPRRFGSRERLRGSVASLPGRPGHHAPRDDLEVRVRCGAGRWAARFGAASSSEALAPNGSRSSRGPQRKPMIGGRRDRHLCGPVGPLPGRPRIRRGRGVAAAVPRSPARPPRPPHHGLDNGQLARLLDATHPALALSSPTAIAIRPGAASAGARTRHPIPRDARPGDLARASLRRWIRGRDSKPNDRLDPRYPRTGAGKKTGR